MGGSQGVQGAEKTLIGTEQETDIEIARTETTGIDQDRYELRSHLHQLLIAIGKDEPNPGIFAFQNKDPDSDA